MGNLGDEAMLLPIVDLLRERFPRASIVVAVGPQAIGAELDARGVQVVPRTKLRLLLEIARSSVFVIAGGTHLASFENDPRHTRGIKRQLSLVTFARLTWSRVWMFSVGFGPFEDSAGEELAQRVLALTHYVTVRDDVSASWLESMDYCNDRYSRCHDAALYVKPAPSAIEGPSLGISLMPFYANYSGDSQKDRELVAALVPILKAWRKIHPDGQVHLCSFLKQETPFSDNQVLRPLRDHFADEAWITLHDDFPDVTATCQRFATFTHFIAMRYHSQVFAWLHRVPQVCILYHRKNADFADECGIPQQACFPVAQVITGEMQSTAEHFFRDATAFVAPNGFSELAGQRDQVVPLHLSE